MNKCQPIRLGLHRCSQVFLLVTACWFGTQIQAIAQTAEQSDPVENTIATAPLRSTIWQESLPDLPPIEPIFPEVTSEIRLVLKLGERKVYVYKEDELYTSYPVAVGRPGWETPTGQYQIIEMIQNPGWTNPFTGEQVPPGADSPLGERWIAFWTDGDNFIGFHGTPNPETVGSAASHGCVRMYNEDVRELYDLVSMGTVVLVEP